MSQGLVTEPNKIITYPSGLCVFFVGRELNLSAGIRAFAHITPVGPRNFPLRLVDCTGGEEPNLVPLTAAKLVDDDEIFCRSVCLKNGHKAVDGLLVLVFDLLLDQHTG
jgi:hypothetical protein